MHIYYENEHGVQFDLLNHKYAVPTNITGLSSLPSNDISTISNAVVDGVTVTNRIRDSRQIVFTHELVGKVTETRRELIRTLDQGASGKIVFDDGDVVAYINVDVEDCEIQNFKGSTTNATTTFFAAYPYWKSFDTKSFVNKGTSKSWTMPWIFPVTFGNLYSHFVFQIENEGDFDTGFTVKIKTHGPVTYPIIANQRDECIHWSDGTQIPEGSEIEIGTETGGKRCTLNGVNSIDKLSETTKMFPLYRGLNTIQVSALSGQEYMDVEIIFEDTFKGV